jgi:hypothetical protein
VVRQGAVAMIKVDVVKIDVMFAMKKHRNVTFYQKKII